jgi:hypothetical protein
MIRNDTPSLLNGFIPFLIHCPPRIIYICIFTFVCFFHPPLSAQDHVKISQPSLKFLNDRLIIKYEIAGYKQEDRFKVWLEITDSTGNKILARSVYGDIGDEVTGGPQKQIIWDLAADSMFLNIDVNIEIFATRKIKPLPVVAEKAVETRPEIKADSAVTKKRSEKFPETKTDTVIIKQRAKKSPETKADTVFMGKNNETRPERKADTGDLATKKSTTEKKEKNRPEKSVKTGSELLLSTVCPGWGLTRLSGGKPYWLLGVAGYGCIASSYYLNKLSYSNYDKYTKSSDITKTDEMDAYYNTGKKQYTASNVLALSAITIWVADLGITWIKASKMKRSAAGAKSGSFSFGSSYDYSADTPLISIYYTF